MGSIKHTAHGMDINHGNYLTKSVRTSTQAFGEHDVQVIDVL
jgi:hypothetical protein